MIKIQLNIVVNFEQALSVTGVKHHPATDGKDVGLPGRQRGLMKSRCFLQASFLFKRFRLTFLTSVAECQDAPQPENEKDIHYKT
jgi:hypothetical protein